jgi:hypothetical protein
MRFTQREVSALVVSALVLGFVFGFDDGRELFEISAWLSNFMLLAALSLVTLIIFTGAQKWTANRYGSAAEYGLWKARRYGLTESFYLHKPGEQGHKGSPLVWIPWGIILPLLIAFLSEGKIFFAVTGMIILTSKPMYRLGKRYVNLTEFETSKVAIAGPLSCIILALVLSLINPGHMFVTWLIKISIAVAIANMLPLPLIAGGVGFFGSKFFYVFSFGFILFAALLVWYVNVIATLLLALIIAIVLVTVAYYFGEVK